MDSVVNYWSAFAGDPTIDFVLGIIVGAGIVGSSVHRTLSVAEGSYWQTTISCNSNSFFYYFSTYFIAKDNITAYLGTCLGAWLVVMFMVYRKRKTKLRRSGEKKSNVITNTGRS